jgi:hypothetical protein
MFTGCTPKRAIGVQSAWLFRQTGVPGDRSLSARCKKNHSSQSRDCCAFR